MNWTRCTHILLRNKLQSVESTIACYAVSNSPSFLSSSFASSDASFSNLLLSIQGVPNWKIAAVPKRTPVLKEHKKLNFSFLSIFRILLPLSQPNQSAAREGGFQPILTPSPLSFLHLSSHRLCQLPQYYSNSRNWLAPA